MWRNLRCLSNIFLLDYLLFSSMFLLDLHGNFMNKLASIDVEIFIDVAHSEVENVIQFLIAFLTSTFRIFKFPIILHG